ncbi:MAG: hypothetical protein JKX83_10915 [Pseudomonadales bacterium]|nr:hypothetical protein [Pseudomonadales bacterium]
MKKYISAALLVLSCSNANATIIDTTNRSFIDQAEHLEWMDFGVNNRYTYNQVVSMTEVGGLYEQWSLATQSQVLTMWDHVFGGRGSDIDSQHATGNSYARYNDKGRRGKSVHEPMLDIIGYNTSHSSLIYRSTYSIGLFEDTRGRLSYAYARDVDYSRFSSPYHWWRGDIAKVAGRTRSFNKYRDSKSRRFSTLLVRNTAPANRSEKIPEPFTLSLFAIGLIGLLAIHKKVIPRDQDAESPSAQSKRPNEV